MDRGGAGEGPAARGGSAIDAPAIGATLGSDGATLGSDGRTLLSRMPLSTSRLAPFSNRASVLENSLSDPKGGASTAASPRAIA